MECSKCTEEIEPRLLNEWTQYGGYKFALCQCPKCETRFRQGKDNAVEFEKFVAEHSVVEEWMTGRPENTRKAYARNLMKFCKAVNLTPEAFQSLSTKEAREKAWMYLSTLKNKPSVYISVLSTAKSFFRNRDGEVLTFDSRRGGKHYCNTKRVKRAAYEHIPNRKEMYKIIDMARGLRDKTILTLLFQSHYG